MKNYSIHKFMNFFARFAFSHSWFFDSLFKNISSSLIFCENSSMHFSFTAHSKIYFSRLFHLLSIFQFICAFYICVFLLHSKCKDFHFLYDFFAFGFSDFSQFLSSLQNLFFSFLPSHATIRFASGWFSRTLFDTLAFFRFASDSLLTTFFSPFQSENEIIFALSSSQAKHSEYFHVVETAFIYFTHSGRMNFCFFFSSLFL